jgi:hypothetical protein
MSPLVFVIGILLVSLKKDQYVNLENALSREFGSIRKRAMPILETDIYALHNWLLKNKKVLGLICVVYSLLDFLFLLKK